MLPLQAGAATDSYTPFDFSNIKTGFRVDQATGDIYNLSTGNKIGNAYSSAQLEDIKGAMVGQDGKLTQNFYDHRGLIAPAGSNVEDNTGILFNPSDSPSNPNSLPIGSIFNPKSQRDYYSLDADSGAVTDTNLPIKLGENPFNIIRDPSTRAQMFDSAGKLKKDVYLSGPTGTMIATAGSTLEADTEKMTYYVTDPSGKRTDLSPILRGASEKIAQEPSLLESIGSGMWSGLKKLGGGVMELVLAVLKFIPALLIILVFLTLAIVASFLASLAALLVSWILSPGFMGVSYTDPANNPIIRIGLDLTQGLVNLALILVLVFIALATILRLAGYETKKLLPVFILVALLVNFSPVICGVIIDASNITMNAFIPKIEGEGIVEFGKSLNARTEGVMTTLKSAGYAMISNLSDAPDKMGQLAGQLVALTFVYASMFVIYLLYALLFMARYVVIWVLVILSPLAFACYILPATKKYWEQWWNNFLQWAFIGAIGAFFINLAEQVAQNMDKIYGNEVPGSTTANVDFIEGIFFAGVPIIFLWIGFFFALQSSAMGAQAVINFGKKAGKIAGKGALTRFDRGLQKSTGWIGKKLGRSGKGFNTVTAARGISRAVDKIPVLRWFQPAGFRKYGQYRPKIEAAGANAKPYDSGSLGRRVLTGADLGEQAAADVLEMVGRGDAEDLFSEGHMLWDKSFKKKNGRDMTDEDILKDERFRKRIREALRTAHGGGLHNTILRGDPRLAALAPGLGIESYAGMTEEAAITKAIGEARSHIVNHEKEVYQNKTVVRGAAGQFDRERFLQINRQVKRGQETFLKTLDEDFTDFVKKAGLFAASEEEKLEAYRKDIIKTTGGEGYFLALKDERFKTTGWRAPKIIGSTPSPGTPGTATGMDKWMAATPVPSRQPSDQGETSRPASQFRARGTPPDQGEDASKKSSKKGKKGGPPDQGEA